MRAYLRKSREGNFILHPYKSMMLGTGYHSPDLQLAKLGFDRGQQQQGQQKVLDHFSRRRLQNQMDFVLSDIDFCYEFLGTEFQQIYPERSYLDLAVEPGRRNKLKVNVRNRSDNILHTASLILCLHLADMIAGNYVTVQAGAPLPALIANDTTDFGEIESNIEMYGMTKTVHDIVPTRAILISQETVVWVDSESYRIAEAKAFREQRQRVAPLPTLEIDGVKQM